MDYGKRSGLVSGAAGFTLVELLLALFLFALIAGVVFAAFAAVASGVEKGRQSMELYRVGRAALLRMAQEIGAALPAPEAATVQDTPVFQGKKVSGGSGFEHDRVDFLTIPYRRARAQIPSYELCTVAYYIDDNRQGKTALFREEDCSGETDNRRERAVRLELTDLAVGLALTYDDVDKNYDEWPPTRDAQQQLPCRVHLALTLRDTQQYERSFITTVVLVTRGACAK
jgi:type II secretion system protein J